MLHPEMYETTMPTIAAIIPLYNGEHYIKEALASVFAQDRPADEIIVVDDGSSDGGPQIVENMLQHEKRLRFFRKSNGGQGSARNFGVANTSCDLIAFLDQDDYWYNNHLSVLEQLFLSKDDGNLGYVYSNPDRVTVNGDMIVPKLLNVLKNQEHPKTSLMSCLANDMYVLPGSSLISRTIFSEVGGFDERFKGYEDDDLFIRIFCAGYRAEYVDRGLYAWRDNPSSTSYSRKIIISREIYFDKISNDDITKNLSKAERSILAHRFARLGSRDIKLVIARNDRETLDLLLRQTMKVSHEMSPYPKFLLRFKVLRRYWLFRARSALETMIGIKRQSRPLPASPE
jgi:glycosyltransferase involved in cell wall biosynthesis